jgi:hypothetical protein
MEAVGVNFEEPVHAANSLESEDHGENAADEQGLAQE